MKQERDKNTISQLRQHIREFERENKKLKTKLELAMFQNYCTICGNILDGYVPPKENLEGLE